MLKAEVWRAVNSELLTVFRKVLFDLNEALCSLI